MQTSKARNGSLEVLQRVSPRAVRQLKPTELDTEAVSTSNRSNRTLKEKSPKVVERYSPRSLVSEKKRPSRVSELELQNSELQEELKKVKDRLNSSESCKNQALQDAKEFKKQLLAMSATLEMCRKPLMEPESELEAIQKQQSFDLAVNEIKRLKDHLEMVAESEAKHTKQAESAHLDLENLKGNLVETLSLVSNMKNRLMDGTELEAQAEVLASETLLQLEAAKKTVEALRSKGLKAAEAYNSIASDLDQSKERVHSLESVFNKLKADSTDAGGSIVEHRTRENEQSEDSHQQEADISSLRSALETAEIKRHEEKIQSMIQIKSAHELMDRIKSEANSREAELLAELEKANFYITNLKANLMDKETELQGISDENEELNMKLEEKVKPSCQRESELENELKALKETVADMKANMMDKETELQHIAEENKMLRSEICKRDMAIGKSNDKVAAELELAKAAKQEAIMKLGLAMEEADKNNSRAAMVAEQLEAAQAELRRVKVQSEQWRKAAELAAAMLTAGNSGKRLIERTGSLDSNYNPRISSPYTEDMEDDFLKKKNANMLKKIGVLWKKQHK